MAKYDTIDKDIRSVTTYPYDVVEGKILTGEYIRKACQRFIDMCHNPDYYFSKEKVNAAINFTSKLKHYNGMKAGENFILLPYQRWIYCAVYGLLYKKNDKRVTHTFILSIGRKNGKSSLLSAMALYALLCDGVASPEIYILANSAKQAGILFKMASNYLKSIGNQKTISKLFKLYRDSIIFPKNDGKIQTLSTDYGRLDGYSPSMAICDETSNAESSGGWDVMQSGMGARFDDSLMCSCSTRSFLLNGFYYEMEQNAIEVLNGLKTDDSLFACIYCCDENDEPMNDESVWIKAQPSLGETVSVDYIREQVLKAKNSPIQEISCRTKLFNEWVSTSTGSMIPMKYVWDSMEKVSLEDYADQGYYGYIGLDLSSVNDISSIALMLKIDDKYIFKNFYYLPQSALTDSPNKEKYRQWANQGYLTLTEGNVIDYDFIIRDIQKLSNQFYIQKINYDPWQSTYLVVKCTELGLPMNPYSQAIGSMTRPTKELMRQFMSGNVILDKNSINNFCYSNAKPYYDANENIKIIKEVATAKIDGVIADVLALAGDLTELNYNNEISGISM